MKSLLSPSRTIAAQTRMPSNAAVRWRILLASGLLVGGVLGALAPRLVQAQTPERPARPELPPSVWVLTAAQKLVQINAATPQKALRTSTLSGLLAGDRLVGIDYRVAKGVMYGLGRSGTLYTLDPAQGKAQVVNPAATPLALGDGPVGFDFNPAADRIRVVQSNGSNHRLHPDTAAVIDFDAQAAGLQTDPKLAYAPSDRQAGTPPDVVAAGYTYNTQNDKLTTNYAIDRRLGTLVLQGSREGVQPVVSPNLGVLTTVGSLGLGPLADAAFDISDLGNVALAVVSTSTSTLPRLVRIHLDTGAASLLGAVAGGEAVVGLAIEP